MAEEVKAEVPKEEPEHVHGENCNHDHDDHDHEHDDDHLDPKSNRG